MIGKNNPFNLRYSRNNGWKGQIGQTKGFCDFDSLSHGVRASAYLILRSYKRKGIVTYSDIVKRFAPPSENNTASYLNYVCEHLNKFPFDIPNSKSEYAQLLCIMSCFEGNPVNYVDVINVLNKYYNDEDFR